MGRQQEKGGRGQSRRRHSVQFQGTEKPLDRPLPSLKPESWWCARPALRCWNRAALDLLLALGSLQRPSQSQATGCWCSGARSPQAALDGTAASKFCLVSAVAPPVRLSPCFSCQNPSRNKREDCWETPLVCLEQNLREAAKASGRKSLESNFS